MHDLRLAEGNHVLRPGIRGTPIRLTVQALVLEEENRVIAADRGAEKSGGIECVRRKDDAQAGKMREHAFAALGVIDGSAGQISADGDTNHYWTRESIVGAPANGGEFVAV